MLQNNETLTPEERYLLYLYRAGDECVKKIILGTAESTVRNVQEHKKIVSISDYFRKV